MEKKTKNSEEQNNIPMANENNNDQKETSKSELKEAKDFDKLAAEAEQDTRTKKPGSQSQSNTGRHNNGRGGGK